MLLRGSGYKALGEDKHLLPMIQKKSLHVRSKAKFGINNTRDWWSQYHYSNTNQDARFLGGFDLEQDAACPKFDKFVVPSADGIGDSFKGWLGNSEGGNFVDEILSLYVNDKMIGVKGKDLKGDNSGVCERLPLKDDECYFTLNTDASFLDALVAKYISFGEVRSVACCCFANFCT